MKSAFDRQICCLTFALIIVLLIGVILSVAINALVESMINDQVVIDSVNAPNYEAWRTNAEGPGTEIKVGYDMMFFNVQNPKSILNGSKPIVVETGPYAFDEYFEKLDIVWTDDGDTVTYNIYKYYIFNQERSGPGLKSSDKLILPYTTALGFQYILSSLPVNTSILIDDAIIPIIDEVYQTALTEIQAIDDAFNKLLPVIKKRFPNFETELLLTQQQLTVIYEELESFIYYSNTPDLIFKGCMCAGAVAKVSPFYEGNVVDAFFGYLNDPVLLKVQALLNVLKENTGIVVPWTSGVPGNTINFTSPDDVRRRRGRDTLKVGKKNKKEIAQYVRFQNMSTFWVCIDYAASQNASLYAEGEEFAACELYNGDWTPEETAAKGYTQPWDTVDANRIEGTDGNLFGRPLITDKIQIFGGLDLFRSAYIGSSKTTDWNGVTVKVFELQSKDLGNGTINPDALEYFSYGPSGVLNISKAINAPVFLSLPHFLDADPILVQSVIGLHPGDDYRSYFHIEPQSGLLVAVDKKVQINFLLQKQTFPNLPPTIPKTVGVICQNLTKLYDTLSGVTTLNFSMPNCTVDLSLDLLDCLTAPSDWNFQNDAIYMPFVWVREYFQLPDSDAEDLKSTLFLAQSLSDSVQFWAYIIAIVIFIIILLMIKLKSYFIQKYINSGNNERDNDTKNALLNAYSNSRSLLL